MTNKKLAHEFNAELDAELGTVISQKQKLFMKYTMMVLIDLVVLGLFNQYWDWVTIDTFSTTLMAAALLQFLLQLTMILEHKVSQLFVNMTGFKAKLCRGLSAWAILFVSKLVILKAISIAFGDNVLFGGPVHGLVAFMVVVVAMVIAEQTYAKLFRSLS